MKADLFETDFSKATVITMFLLPDINLKLRPKILELKPGTRVVSNTFTMDDWKADETVTLDANAGCTTSWCTALLWIVPARAEGSYTLPQGELVLKQQFQVLSGTLTTEGRTLAVDGKVRGNDSQLHRRRQDLPRQDERHAPGDALSPRPGGSGPGPAHATANPDPGGARAGKRRARFSAPSSGS